MVANAQAASRGELTGKVLYIEDNPINILVMTQWAARHPSLRFEVSENGQDGVSRFASFRPDVVLLDMQLPDCDGLEVLRRLRELPAGGSVPVAIVSAFSDAAVRRDALNAGAVAYWLKPVDFSHLERELRAMLPAVPERSD